VSQDPTPSDDFDTAKSVVDKLSALPKDRQERVLRWVSESLGLSSPAPAATAGHPAAPEHIPAGRPAPAPGSSKDIKAFVAEKAPKSDNQFAATVAYFYKFESTAAARRDAIDGSVLQEAARLAGWRRPKRPTDTLNNARKAGYLDSAERGSFTLNNVGENLVAMALPSGNTIAGKRKKSRKAASGKKTKPQRK
jgi:hypothetical protein